MMIASKMADAVAAAVRIVLEALVVFFVNLLLLVSVVVKDKFDAPINDVDLSSAKPLSKLLRKRVLKERI